MSRVWRASALAATAVVLGAFLAAVPAGAQQTDTIVTAPEAFIASASARGLDINLLGTHISVGTSGALIQSTPKAQAQGAGVLLVAGTVANALAEGATTSQAPPKACVLDVPLLGLLSLATACGEAAASIANGLPQAGATGTIASIVLGGSLLTPLLQQVGALVGQTVGTVLDPLTALLGGLLNPLLGALNLNVSSLVDDLLAGLQRATGVLSITLGPSASTATTTASKVNATGVAQGASIQVLPGLSALGAPLVTVTVGAARASVDVTRPAASQSGPVTATAVPSFEAALVRVDLGVPILGNIMSIPVTLGAPLTLLAGTPLESTIALGGGSVADGPNGSKVAVADGVSLQLLKGLSGGIGLALAHAEASGGGLSAQISVQERIQPVVQPQPELVRTGGVAWFPMLGAVLLFGAYATRRLVTVRR
ncbi:MAG: hypothetical protein ACRD2W_10905 [Acidimicrobiales bacterium]